jgi:DNA primase catalytic subunit
MVDGKTGKNSAAAKAKELPIIIGRKIIDVVLIYLLQLGYILGHMLKLLATSAGRKIKSMGKQKGRELESVVVKKSKKAKDVGTQSRPLLRELATDISVEANKAIEQTKRGIKADMKATKASNLAKSSEELPEIVTKTENLNETLAQEAWKETGIDCEAIELNSLAIENRPYYSYKLPMSPKIVTNRGCIKVNGKSFGLIQIIQRN